MAITGVTNLAELTSNQPTGQAPGAPAAAKPVQTQRADVATPIDTFTPSAQTDSAQTTAQAAGLFQVSPFALSSANANILSAQTAASRVTQGATPQDKQTGTNEQGAAPGAPAANPDTTNAPIQAPTPAPAAAPASAVNPQAAANAADPAAVPAPAATPAPTTPAPAVSTQSTENATENLAANGTANVSTTLSARAQAQLESLNADLSGLGLDNGQIQDIDLIASATKDFNSAAYDDLIQQFSTKSEQPTTATAAAKQPPPDATTQVD